MFISVNFQSLTSNPRCFSASFFVFPSYDILLSNIPSFWQAFWVFLFISWMIGLWQKLWRNFSKTTRNGASILVAGVAFGLWIWFYLNVLIFLPISCFHIFSLKNCFLCIWLTSMYSYLLIVLICRLPTIQQEVQQRKLLYMGLYLLIWGEAANLRFMPECLCYIYHHVKFCNFYITFMLDLNMVILLVCLSLSSFGTLPFLNSYIFRTLFLHPVTYNPNLGICSLICIYFIKNNLAS